MNTISAQPTKTNRRKIQATTTQTEKENKSYLKMQSRELTFMFLNKRYF